MPPIERPRLDGCEVDAIETAYVHVDLVGMRTWNVVDAYTTISAEQMFSNARAERVERHVSVAAKRAEAVPIDDEVKKTLLGAYRAIALKRFGQIAFNFES